MASPASEQHTHADPCTVPPGLFEILEEFSTQVLRQKPENIYCFLADYCEAKLKGLIPGGGNVKGQNPNTVGAPLTGCGPPTGAAFKQLEDQSQLLEKLRHEVTSSMQPRIEGQLGSLNSRPCVKDQITSVLGQALELVGTLEQLQQIAPDCQDHGSNPDGTFWLGQPVGGQMPLTQQDICNQIHCLVKYIDQLSQQFDLALGNTNCPYHEGQWMPECNGCGYMDPNMAQWNTATGQGTGFFEIGDPISEGMLYVIPEIPNDICCAEASSDAFDCSGNVLLIAPQVQKDQTNSGFGAVAGCVDAEYVEQHAVILGPAHGQCSAAPPGDSAHSQAGVSAQAEVAATAQSVAGASAQADQKPGSSAQSQPPSITQSIANLFGAENEKGLETTIRAINSNMSTFWQVSNATATGEWAAIIQDFLGNQLSIIQKLLTGQMPLSEAPYEVAFLTVAFIMGVVVGYRQFSSGSTGTTGATDWARNSNVVFIDRFAANPNPNC